MIEPLTRSDQALLFLYLLEKGLPDWYGDMGDMSQRCKQEKVFARLMNITESEAREAFFVACEKGMMEFNNGNPEEPANDHDQN